jgi:16S rRNA (guanine527-N7)-methyltransferase
MSGTLPAAEFDWEERIRSRASACGIALAAPTVSALALHARWVLRANVELKLTTVIDPGEFLERHLGESFEGAALLDPGTSGPALDIGSGNGYPGLPIAAARPGLALTLAESSVRKAQFLRQILRETDALAAEVLERQVQRAADLEGFGPARVITSRAMGGWPKILPRLASLLAPDGEILVWAGEQAEAVAKRVAWRRFTLAARKPLPGRDQSWIWVFRRAGP